MPAPQKSNQPRNIPPRASRPETAGAAASAAKPPPPAHSTELGWLPDFVYTGDKFEAGLAFFADPLGRITRFSREPADLAIARRLAGQAALPGLVNGHSLAWQRASRGRAERPARGGAKASALDEAAAHVLDRLTPDEVFEVSRMTFMEMLLAGITCVGEFHVLHNQPDGSPFATPHELARQVLRAAHDVGIRIALFNVATLRAGPGQPVGSAPSRLRSASVDAFLRESELLRNEAAAYPADEAWLGIGGDSVATVPIDALKAIAAYAHTQRLRFQTRLGAADAEACRAEHGRSPIALLAEQGIVDKRFTVVHGVHLTDDDCRLLGSARAIFCACPGAEHNAGNDSAPVQMLLEAGVGLAFGSAGNGHLDLLKEARLLEYSLRHIQHKRPALAPDVAKTLFHAATATGARSLGATGGALEVGRPADFFTVNVYDPSIAGADADSLLANIVFALERRAIRDVWIGARQRIANGRHAEHGPIVGRFVDLQRRLWS